MDTTTIQGIIKMINHNLTELEVNSIDMRDEYYFGAKHTLNNLRKHLQEYIEAELNKAELQSGE